MEFSVFSLMPWPHGGASQQACADALAQLTTADSQGYAGAWIAEHPLSPYGIGPSTHLAAAHLSARTSRIRIGTHGALRPGFHRLRLAEEIAMLDIMSGGRFDWGLACSDPVTDSARSHPEGRLVFREQLEIVKRAWTGQTFSYEGEFFQTPEVVCLPTPVQQPHPPIWITAPSPPALEWAAQNDYPMLSDAFAPTDRIAEQRAVYLAAGEEAGHPVARHRLPVVRLLFVGETTAKAREQVASGLLGYYRALSRMASNRQSDAESPEHNAFHETLGRDGIGPDAGPDEFLDFLFENCAIVGDEACCCDKIAELDERIGLTSLICWQNFADLSHEASLASQQRLIERVAPSFS